MKPSPSAVETLRLSKSIGGRWVLRDVDLRIDAGECVALTGCNGAGKTTLVRCLAAITGPSSGEVRWFGRSAGQSRQQRRRVGWVGHDHGLYVHLTVRENLLFAARMGLIDDASRHVDSAIERFGLRAIADLQVRHASKGMVQRSTLARALTLGPEVLLLDEPFTGLDQASCDWLARLLSELSGDGCAICFTTHNGVLANALAHRTVILQDGRLSLVDQPAGTAVRADRGGIAA